MLKLNVVNTTILLVSSLFLRCVEIANASSSSPVLAGPPDKYCLKTVRRDGTPTGEVIFIGGMNTYVSSPHKHTKGAKKILLFFSDVYGPFDPNAKLVQDQYAENGFTVLGPDYFFGDYISLHMNDTNFQAVPWIQNKTVIAREAIPEWLGAVKQKYGPNGQEYKYTVVGYCFGAPNALDVAATDDVVAVSFAHPSSFVTEAQFRNLKQPLLIALAENDTVFPKKASRRTEDILVEEHANYHIQTFSGTTHGFVTRGDRNNATIRWSQDTAVQSVVDWADRSSD
ncbi:hypothetical protein NLJ89_g6349 [Agrocybe chaxingu]|uniref:Dienelactone hydrolase domain-containing protein n=1 Tax=Agrocybe chaxingu TaxID=84603 RepID=A0A9W8K6L1_9AGAR|nr:hypothetical protein NLJ89_g6349 [Agrocybe chaxingu]